MERAHQIYFVQRADGLIKIGYSSSLDNRITQLRKSHEGLEVLKVINGDRRLERELHYQFQSCQEYGEWFRPDPILLDAIAKMDAGRRVTFKKSESQEAWKAYEASIAAEVLADANRLYAMFFRPSMDNQESVVRRISEKHGIPEWPLRHLLSGRCAIPSAALAKRIRQAIVSESEARIASLKAELEDLSKPEDFEAELSILDRVDALKGRLREARGRLQ